MDLERERAKHRFALMEANAQRMAAEAASATFGVGPLHSDRPPPKPAEMFMLPGSLAEPPRVQPVR